MEREPYDEEADRPQSGVYPAGDDDEIGLHQTEEQETERDNQLDREEGAEDESRGLDGDPGQGQVRRRTRDENMAGLRDMARLEREKADRLEREVAELRRQQWEFQQQRSQQTREERLALMAPEQRTEYLLEEAQRQNQQMIQRMQFEQALLNDKLAYTTQASGDQHRQRLMQQVEQLQQQEIQQGRFWTRDQVYRYLRGQEVVENESKPSRIRSPGAQRQRVEAPNPRGDQVPARSRGSRPRTLEEREEALSKIRF